MTKKYSVKLHTSQTVHFGTIYWTQHGYRNPLKGIYGLTRFPYTNGHEIPQVF